MKVVISLLVFLVSAHLAVAQEEKVLLENEWVRVVYVKDGPGNKRPDHSHRDTLVYPLTDFQVRVTRPGDKPTDIDVRAGQAAWFANVTHSEENIGKTAGERLIIDIKKPAGSWKPVSPGDDPAKWPESLEAVTAAPENHEIVFENERIRVLDVTVAPGENEPLHMHRMPSLLYIIAEDDIQDFDASGKLLYDTRSQKAPPKTPYAEWMPPQAPHRVVNRSKNALRLVRVEVK